MNPRTPGPGSRIPKERIDKLLVERGLAESRERAQSLVMAGLVLANEQRIDKPGKLVDTRSELRVKGEGLRYVGRGGLKLEAALDAFGVDPADKVWIDVGASTGGFTDCLLQRGARRVWAIDVGHNQLHYRIRTDPRVEVREGVNARNLDPAMFPQHFDGAVVDVSFISLKLVLPALVPLLAERAMAIVLVKPQFEVGRGEVGKGGVVRDEAKRQRVLSEIEAAATKLGLELVGAIDSPILGASGNKEFLLVVRSGE
jgi:23S rRNA (cytidine1920-2'-O)/16S rRNA (cytidine1409-2'-O)-methyltransferase